jgi:hypothetical protein
VQCFPDGELAFFSINSDQDRDGQIGEFTRSRMACFITSEGIETKISYIIAPSSRHVDPNDAIAHNCPISAHLDRSVLRLTLVHQRERPCGRHTEKNITQNDLIISITILVISNSV